MLHALTEESSAVADAIGCMTEEDRKKFYPNQTASEWHARRVKGRKVASNKKVRRLANITIYLFTKFCVIPRNWIAIKTALAWNTANLHTKRAFLTYRKETS